MNLDEISRRLKPQRVDSRSSSAKRSTLGGKKTLRDLLSGKKNNLSLSPDRSVESFARNTPKRNQRKYENN